MEQQLELSFGAFLGYVWRQMFSWNGFIQLLNWLWILGGACFRLVCALLYALVYYWDAVILYFLTDYCGLEASSTGHTNTTVRTT